jgi:hypothetical protein
MTINLFDREAVWGSEEEIEGDAEKLDIPQVGERGT